MSLCQTSIIADRRQRGPLVDTGHAKDAPSLSNPRFSFALALLHCANPPVANGHRVCCSVREAFGSRDAPSPNPYLGFFRRVRGCGANTLRFACPVLAESRHSREHRQNEMSPIHCRNGVDAPRRYGSLSMPGFIPNDGHTPNGRGARIRVQAEGRLGSNMLKITDPPRISAPAAIR